MPSPRVETWGYKDSRSGCAPIQGAENFKNINNTQSKQGNLTENG
jgi:hypothetical protein